MSLTSNIKQKGWMYQLVASLLDLKFSEELYRSHNEQLNTAPRHIPGDLHLIDRKLSGMAMTYALRDVLCDNPVTFLQQVMAYRALVHTETYSIFREALTSTEPLDRAPIYVCLAALDSYARGGDLPGWFPSNVKSLPASSHLHQSIKPTVDDVARLLPGLHQSIELLFSQFPTTSFAQIQLNPTFSGGYLVGGADAQLIVDGYLWDVRTTFSRFPFSFDNICQQLGYCILDFDNRYNISHLVWYYTRQNCLFTYPLSQIPFNLEKAREEVRKRSTASDRNQLRGEFQRQIKAQYPFLLG